VKHAVAVAATVLGSLLGISQTGFWCEWLCDALASYWARSGDQRSGEEPHRSLIDPARGGQSHGTYSEHTRS